MIKINVKSENNLKFILFAVVSNISYHNPLHLSNLIQVTKYRQRFILHNLVSFRDLYY